jgi:uncharacterized protein YktB (UPF0637 family)
MDKDIPNNLFSTYQMLDGAFGNGIQEKQYFALLDILYEELSDRNLALIMSKITKKEYSEVLNDIYKLSKTIIKEDMHKEVLDRLKVYGYDDWLKEE